MRRIIKGLPVLAFFLLVCTAVSARAATEQQAKPLVVYVAFHESEGKRLLEEFEKRTGVHFQFLRMPAGEIVSRVEAEKDAPRADIILGGGAENHEVLKRDGLLEAYNSPSAEGIPSQYKDKDGYWTGFYLGPIAIGVNEQRWKKEFAPKGLTLPKTFEDLLNPAFKGEIVLPDPVSSGTGYTLISSILQIMGDKKGFAFLKKLHLQVRQLVASGFKPAELAGKGNYLICLNFLHDQLLVKKRGLPLLSVVPQGAGWEIGAVSIVKGSSNPEATKLFIDFVLGADAGSIHSAMTSRLSTRADVPVPEGNFPLDTLPINKSFNLIKAAEEREIVLEQWEEIHQNTVGN